MIATTSRPAPATVPADHPVLRALLSRPYPAVMGVLNGTPDSFSDGGQADTSARSLEIAAKAGISRGNIVLDPGIGFGKTPEQSMTALARLNELSAFGLPLLVGASRKRFISSVVSSEPDRRLGGSIAAHVVAAKGGARIIRTHDVSETVQALRVAAAIWDRR